MTEFLEFVLEAIGSALEVSRWWRFLLCVLGGVLIGLWISSRLPSGKLRTGCLAGTGVVSVLCGATWESRKK